MILAKLFNARVCGRNDGRELALNGGLHIEVWQNKYWRPFVHRGNSPLSTLI